MYKEIKTAASIDAITVEQVKTLTFTNTDQLDTMIGDLIPGAVSWAEDWTGRSFITQHWYIYYGIPEFKNVMDLSTINVNSITEVLSYDKDDVSSAMSATKYRLQNDKIKFDENETFSSLSLREQDTIRIEVIAGYSATTAAMPEDILTALAQLVLYWAHTSKMAYSKSDYKQIPLGVKGKLLRYQKRTQWM